MGVLYKLDFSNGKSYIGISSISLMSRLKKHRDIASRKAGAKNYAIHDAWRKHGAPVAKVLAILENKDLASAEIRAIRIYKTLTPHGYNLTIGGDGVVGNKLSQIAKDKLRAANLGKKQSKETIAKRSASMMGRVCSEETKRKIGIKNAINMKGKSPSEHTRSLISAKSKGRTHSVSEEGKARMRAAKLGTKQSAETIEKRRIALTGLKRSPEILKQMSIRNKGKVISEEAKIKMRAAKLGKKQSAETIEKRRIALTGIKHPASFGKAVGDRNRCRKLTNETKSKLSAAAKAYHARRREALDNPVK